MNRNASSFQLTSYVNKPDRSAIYENNYLYATEQAREAVKKNLLITMDWPPPSPDLNITEHICDYLDLEKQKMQNQFLRQNIGGVEKRPYRFLWETESKSPKTNGSCKKRQWMDTLNAENLDIIFSCWGFCVILGKLNEWWSLTFSQYCIFWLYTVHLFKAAWILISIQF